MKTIEVKATAQQILRFQIAKLSEVASEITRVTSAIDAAEEPAPPEPDDEYLLPAEPNGYAFDTAMTSTDVRVIVDALAEVGLPRNVWVGGVAKALASANARAGEAEVKLTRLAELFMDEHGDLQGELDDWVPGDVDEIVAILLPYLPGEKEEEEGIDSVFVDVVDDEPLIRTKIRSLAYVDPAWPGNPKDRAQVIADALNTVLRKLPSSEAARRLRELVE